MNRVRKGNRINLEQLKLIKKIKSKTKTHTMLISVLFSDRSSLNIAVMKHGKKGERPKAINKLFLFCHKSVTNESGT